MIAPLAHRLEGDGPPVVLLNGGMMTHPSWEPVAAVLRTRYRVLRFDFRGQLLSPGEPPADLAGHADDVAALIEELGLAPAHLVGTSFGGEVAIALAAARPELVRSLLLVAAMDRETPAFRQGSDEMRRMLRDVVAGGDRGAFHDVLVEGIYSAPYRTAHEAELLARRQQIAKLPVEWFAGVLRLLDAVDGFDVSHELAAISCPALVAIATDDQVMDPERSQALAAALGAETFVHPTSGHALVAEDPQWVARVCLSFLDAQESQEGP